jgi:triosephosphate isomerase
VRRPVLAANWKMHMTAGETVALAKKILPCQERAGEADIVICPPFTSLAPACSVFQGTGLQVGAQNMHWEDSGAFTGEISAPMLKEIGCTHVIIGHSERRQLFGETDAAINCKLKAALRHGLIPIFCLGETLEQREAGTTQEVCAHQLEQGLAGIQSGDLAKTIIAYEPVWAIGTGRTASPEDAQAVISFIRRELGKKHSHFADQVRILYGGSVKPENIDGLMAQQDIDGALVGGASLDADSFSKIVNYGGAEQ